jgi:hypothetical protein
MEIVRLDAACGPPISCIKPVNEDEDMRSEVESLLASYEQLDGDALERRV